MKKFNFAFLGTPDICIPCLELLDSHRFINLKLIISMPDRPKGRGKKMSSPEVATWAKEKKINLIQTSNINKNDEFKLFIKENRIDVIIVYAFSQFLGKFILESPSLGCFNIHTSILPKYRGAAPIQYAILNGDQSTGVSIQKMVKKMDAGDICKSNECDIAPEDTSEILYNKLKLKSAELLNDFIKDIQNEAIKYTIQDDAKVSFAPVIKKEQGFINFKEENSTQIINRFKAFTPWPGTYFYLNDKRIKIIDIQIDSLNLKAGIVSTDFNSLLIGTKTDTLRVKTLQLEGKKHCRDIDFINGFKNTITQFLITEKP